MDPVGGSANDYDYRSADPINCFDLPGTYRDSYSFDVGAAEGAANAVFL
ncbi:MAG: hypothetical protein ACRD0M_11365 [Acidimicrobiales bacterium]